MSQPQITKITHVPYGALQDWYVTLGRFHDFSISHETGWILTPLFPVDLTCRCTLNSTLPYPSYIRSNQLKDGYGKTRVKF